jgi:glycosyltransferase involved in cell wall biosynthesis
MRIGIFTSSRAVSLFKVSRDIAEVLSGLGHDTFIEQGGYRFRTVQRVDAGIVMMPVDLSLCATYLYTCYRLRSIGKRAIYYGTVEGDIRNPWALEWVEDFVDFVANSKYTCEKLKKAGYTVLDIVYHGIDVKRFEDARKIGLKTRAMARLPSNTFLVGYIASGHRRKGHDQVSAIAKIMAEKDPDVRFLIVSDDRARRWYTGLNNVIYLDKFGKLDEDSVKALYGMFDIYAQFSLSEGFGMPVLEALAAGTPIIHPDYNPLSEITTPDTSFRVPVRGRRIYREVAGIDYELHMYDPNEFVEILLQAKDEVKRRRNEIAELEMERARMFDLSSTYPRLAEILEKIEVIEVPYAKSLFMSASS